MEVFAPYRLLEQRRDQRSFHIASERHLRIEFMRFEVGEKVGPLRYDGDVLILILEGRFSVGDPVVRCDAREQVIIAHGDTLLVQCEGGPGAIELIWTPPFAPVENESRTGA